MLSVQSWRLAWAVFRWVCSNLVGQHQGCLHVLFETGCLCLACLCRYRLNFLFLFQNSNPNPWGWGDGPYYPFCFGFLCSCNFFMQIPKTFADCVPWKKCDCLQEQSQCVPQSGCKDFWSGWFGTILQGSLCPCQCCASLIQHCCCLGFLYSFKQTATGQNLLSCEAALLACQELYRVNRSTEVNPNSSSCRLKLV